MALSYAKTSTLRVCAMMAATIVSLILGLPHLKAEMPGMHAGTLTCTTENDAGPTRDLKCSYQPIGGASATLTGRLRKLDLSDRDTRTPDRVTYLWAVHGPTADIPASSVAGEYVSTGQPEQTEPGAPPAIQALVGGWNKSIKLVPAGPLQEKMQSNADAIALELTLEAVKT